MEKQPGKNNKTDSDEKNMEIDDEYETKYFKAPTITSMKELEGFGSGESI